MGAYQLEGGHSICQTKNILPPQESFTLEKYVEKLAQLNPDTGLGPLHRNKDKSKPFNPEVHEHVACKSRQTKIMILLVATCTT